MIFATPPIEGSLGVQLDQLGELRAALGERTSGRPRWIGALRRQVRASSVQSSTSIEGFSVSPEEALELTSRRDVADHADEDRAAVACYARAIDRAATLAGDPSFRWLDRVILDLHFDACYFQADKGPGLWRTGPIGVTAADGSLEFRGPDAELVPGLMDEVVEWLAAGDLDADPFVRAAMAHLHVTSVHPFRDGNGRISRIVQSLVLAQAGIAAPEFFSIEEYLRDHTPRYYAALRETQGGGYHPERDASGWVSFCLDAHVAQAERRLHQVEAAAARWQHLEALVSERGWPDRLVIALEQSLLLGADRHSYAQEADVSPATASADFRRLLDAGLVSQRGRGPSTRYLASESLRAEATRH